MSQGVSCKCPESKKPVGERRWVVIQRNCNHSAFNGYRQTFSDYSSVTCHVCAVIWRTKASYVNRLPNGVHMYDLPPASPDAPPDPPKNFLPKNFPY